MTTLEFVAFDANGKEVDWVDPVRDHRQVTENIWEVDNGLDVYPVRIPEGGRYELRVRED